MTAIRGEKLSVGQRSGPEVELVVFGDEFYARYETLDGYSAVYDDERGLFCYARLVDGAFVSSGVPVSASAPPGAVLHGKESDAVRQARHGTAHARKFPSQQASKGGSHERDPQ